MQGTRAKSNMVVEVPAHKEEGETEEEIGNSSKPSVSDKSREGDQVGLNDNDGDGTRGSNGTAYLKPNSGGGGGSGSTFVKPMAIIPLSTLSCTGRRR